MLSSSLENLRSTFVGKICTILTVGVNKGGFPDQQFAEFFTGIVEAIDQDGVFTKHHLTNCKNFYSMQYIVGIVEEQMITEDDPNYQQIIEEVKKAPQQAPAPAAQPPMQFVDPSMLAALQKQAQQNMGKMLQKNQP
jgi:hypothetical protein